MDSREARLGRNESLFREVNERIEEIAADRTDGDHQYEFVCECANPDCTLHISMTIGQYEAVRAEGARFAVAKGHALPEIEHVVEEHASFDVILKQDEAGEEAEKRDPRKTR
jgi:hypothetical protein